MSVVYDTGALLAAERRSNDMWAFHDEALKDELDVVVPAVVLAQAWRGGPQPLLSRLLRGCVVEAFDENAGRAVGRLLRDAGTSDIVDAAVVLTAIRHRAVVVTPDPEDIEDLLLAMNRKLPIYAV
jgi:predicted nucleic acid-binding protein